MPDSTVADIRLRDFLHGNRRLHTDGNVKLLERVRHAQRVDGGSEHTHMVGTRPIHLAAAASTPEITPAHHDGNLNAHFNTGLDWLTDGEHGVKVNAVLLIARERFPAELQKDAFILWLQDITPLFSLQKRILSVFIPRRDIFFRFILQ